jgi:hypothetical protein
MTWWLKILISLALKTVFAYIYPKIDVELYYKRFEQMIEKHVSAGKIFNWLFEKKDVKVFGTIYKQAVPRYRIFHASVMIVYWLSAWIFFYSSVYSDIWLCLLVFFIDAVIGVAWAYWKMTFERFYYTISDTVHDLLRYQLENLDVYWLKRKWFYGYFCFRISFLVHVFDESAFIGLIGMYLTSIIYLIIHLII